jgi:osmotically-inducible protein OsmY
VQIPPQQPANPEDALGFPERTEAPQFEQPAGEPDFNQQPTAEPGDMEGGLGESESIQSGDPAMIVRDKFPNLADEVQVDVSPEGVVELSGDVPRLADKLAMGEAVSEAPGSGLIVNKIDVKAPKRSDGAITREVRNKLRKDEFLQNYNINVRTREQRVYLRGEVPSYVAVEEALRQAAEVEGVRDVIVSDLRMPLPP